MRRTNVSHTAFRAVGWPFTDTERILSQPSWIVLSN